MAFRNSVLALCTIVTAGMLFTGCKGTDDNVDLGSKQMDTGGGVELDAGVMMNQDTGVMMGMDTGVAGPCNPVDGTGCTDANTFCVFQGNSGDGQCRTLPAQNTFEAACDAALQDCAPGLACIDLGMGATCMKVCETASGNGCAGLMGTSPQYACSPLNTPNTTYGLCIGTGNDCNPAQRQNACMAGETCSITGPTMTSCLPAGATLVDGDCSMDNCTSGNICVDFGMGATCFEPCDPMNPNNPMCAMGRVCQGLQDQGGNPLSWGVCLEDNTVGCDPINPMCMAGETCTVTAGDGSTGCLPGGTAMLGQTCGGANNCAPGQGICLDLGMGATCRQPCDPMNAMDPICGMGMCQGLMVGGMALPWGVCNP